MEIGELTEEERRTLLDLQKKNLDNRLLLSEITIKMEELEVEKRKIVHTLQSLPHQEQAFKDSLTLRLGTEKWDVRGDGKIYSED